MAMARPCTICTSTERAEIERKMLSGTPNRRVAAQHGVSEQAIRRHGEQHLRTALELARTKRADDREQSLLEQLHDVHRRVRAVADEAERTGDGRLAIAAAREIRACIEALGKWTGEFREQHEHLLRAEPLHPEVAAQFAEAVKLLAERARRPPDTFDIVNNPHIFEGEAAVPRYPVVEAESRPQARGHLLPREMRGFATALGAQKKADDRPRPSARRRVLLLHRTVTELKQIRGVHPEPTPGLEPGTC